MAPATPEGTPLPRGPDGGNKDGGGAVQPLRGALARLAHAMSRPTAAASDRGGGGGDGGAEPGASVAGAAGLPARVQLAQGGAAAAAARCLKMANVNYFPPACAAAPAAANHHHAVAAAAAAAAAASSSSTAATGTAAAVAPLPRVLAMTTRGQPDSFEDGPSWGWRHVSWGGPVRAKWLYAAAALAPNPSVPISDHSRSCLSPSLTRVCADVGRRSRVQGQRRGGRPRRGVDPPLLPAHDDEGRRTAAPAGAAAQGQGGQAARPSGGLHRGRGGLRRSGSLRVAGAAADRDLARAPPSWLQPPPCRRCPC